MGPTNHSRKSCPAMTEQQHITRWCVTGLTKLPAPSNCFTMADCQTMSADAFSTDDDARSGTNTRCTTPERPCEDHSTDLQVASKESEKGSANQPVKWAAAQLRAAQADGARLKRSEASIREKPLREFSSGTILMYDGCAW